MDFLYNGSSWSTHRFVNNQLTVNLFCVQTGILYIMYNCTICTVEHRYIRAKNTKMEGGELHSGSIVYLKGQKLKN